ncbi:MAG: response regulator [Atopobiaceae bacterium]|nr:response regulator [Atopobiaceae bacterium]
MNILIVDDERFQHDELATVIEAVSPGNEYSFASSYDEALERFAERPRAVAFLDVEMPGRGGVELARELRRLNPSLNIIMATAYSEYALEALRLFVSGYIVKPVREDEVREVLANLRNPVERVADGEGADQAGRSDKPRMRVKCFGNFEVFDADGRPMRFARQKEKELLAYLVCLHGATATAGQICAALFEWGEPRRNASYFRKISSALRGTLRRAGYEDVLVHARNAYGVDAGRIDCDYYDHLDGNRGAYAGEFMYQYGWAEQFKYGLDHY